MAVDIPYADPEQPILLTCVVANTPTTTGEKLWVTIPSLASNQRIQVNWEPHGATYPAAGTGGLIGFDENGDAWLLMWIGGWS